ncbi:MAG: preprotein translocase subunit SecG [Methylomonas sp.]|nr:MAG: preprotein translocase subunit SecG [Methylomonas sp.]
MYQIIIVIHILLGIGIIGLVLMQQGKGADAGAAFGSGASGSVFGAQGSASFLSRSTAIFATLFFITSLGLAFLSGYQTKKTDIMDAPVVEKVLSDVPLSQNKVEDSVPVAELPTAPVIKEVEAGN